jgi:hypothetical protein
MARVARPKESNNPPKTPKPVAKTTARSESAAAPAATPMPTPAAVSEEPPPLPTEPDDFPAGWELKKESWHFHRRFYAIFKRPMRRGEYSHLLWQVRRRTAEHLWEDCWRVRLPGGDLTLQVRATRWQLITILPKHWQPPTRAE